MTCKSNILETFAPQPNKKIQRYTHMDISAMGGDLTFPKLNNEALHSPSLFIFCNGQNNLSEFNPPKVLIPSVNHEYYSRHCLCTLDLHRKMRAVQEFWNSTQIQKGKKKMKTNQKTSSEPQEAKCMQTVIQNKQGKYFSQWERGGKKLKTWIGILSIFISWWWYFIEWLRIDLSAW